ncbi:CDP-glycerol glycerophosphotransferase family protein [Pseudomonas shirazensis]|uniref:CDP-glycerol glycerophosphotransferase family protein n=1 Tax=Pseudomonas shirazensis TaxID=2745494 RepID=UPI003D016AB4
MLDNNKLSAGRLAVLYQLPESWANVRSVWEAARAEQLDVVVIMLPFIHRDYQWQREVAEAHLKSMDVDYVAWDEFDLEAAKLDAVLYTSPYDETRPEAYRFANLRQHVRHTSYVPYALDVGDGDLNYFYQYAQPVITGSSAVFVRSENVRALFAKYCPSGCAHVHITGHPRMDSLTDLEDFEVDPALTVAIGQRTPVLWNAHFSFDGDYWSTFDQLARAIFDAFLVRPHLALIFRPHPLLWKKLINLNIFDQAGVANLKDELRARGIIIDDRADHRHAFAASSAMISDASSFLLEYLVTRKPVLYLCNPHGLGLNDEGKAVVEHYRTARDGADIGAFLDQIGAADGPLAAGRQAAIEHFFHGFDGQAGQRVLNVLKGLMA